MSRAQPLRSGSHWHYITSLLYSRVKTRQCSWDVMALISAVYATPLPDSDANFITDQSGTFSRELGRALTLPRHRLSHLAEKKFP
jgi:hypothetical protein